MLSLSHGLSCETRAQLTELGLDLSTHYHAKANFSDFLQVANFGGNDCVFRIIVYHIQEYSKYICTYICLCIPEGYSQN